MDQLNLDLEWDEESDPYGRLHCEGSLGTLPDYGPLGSVECGVVSPEVAMTSGVCGAKDLVLGQAKEEMAGMVPGPATLWGILLSEVPTKAVTGSTLPSECEKAYGDVSLDLWVAAGYDCQLPMVEVVASPAVQDLLPINDEESMHSYQSPHPIGPYVVKTSPGKGQGIFASRNVSRGERILMDKPFFIVTKPYTPKTVLSDFERMPLERRTQYMQLYCPDRPDDIHMTDVMRIFEANCFNIGDKAAMFLTATRFNHSCLPNAYYSWSGGREELRLHSMLDIPEGEEMTICYGNPFCTFRQRQYELRIYNFDCNCPACQVGTVFGQASESRRCAMETLNKQIIMFQTDSDEALLRQGLQDPLTAILQLIETIKEEGLHGELMTPYRYAVDCLKSRGNFKEALKFAQLELGEEVVCLGNDSDVVRETIEYIEELEAEFESSK